MSTRRKKKPENTAHTEKAFLASEIEKGIHRSFIENKQSY
jgi:hypothetical protein